MCGAIKKDAAQQLLIILLRFLYVVLYTRARSNKIGRKI